MSHNQNALVNLDAKYRKMLVLWFAFVSSIVVYLLVALFILRPAGEENRLLNMIFSAASSFLAVVSFAVKKIFLSRAEEKQQIQLVTTGYLLAALLCETGAIMGLLNRFLAHSNYYFLLIVLPLIALLFHFPRRSHLQSAIYRLPANSSEFGQQ